MPFVDNQVLPLVKQYEASLDAMEQCAAEILKIQNPKNEDYDHHTEDPTAEKRIETLNAETDKRKQLLNEITNLLMTEGNEVTDETSVLIRETAKREINTVAVLSQAYSILGEQLNDISVTQDNFSQLSDSYGQWSPTDPPQE